MSAFKTQAEPAVGDAAVGELATSRRPSRNTLAVERAAAFRSIPDTNHRVPHISLVFREMWDTAGPPLKPIAVSTTP